MTRHIVIWTYPLFCATALRQLYSGKFTPSFTQQAASGTARFIGAGEWSDTVGGGFDMSVGIVGPGWAGYVTSPSIVAGRVTLADQQRLSQPLLNLGERPIGTTGAYVQSNYLFPNVYTGQSSRAALQSRLVYPVLDQETKTLLQRFASEFNWACAEGPCISKAVNATGKLPTGGAMSVRSIFSAGELEACDACGPILQKLGIFKNAPTPKSR